MRDHAAPSYCPVTVGEQKGVQTAFSDYFRFEHWTLPSCEKHVRQQVCRGVPSHAIFIAPTLYQLNSCFWEREILQSAFVTIPALGLILGAAQVRTRTCIVQS